jgi:hypothetical protein
MKNVYPKIIWFFLLCFAVQLQAQNKASLTALHAEPAKNAMYKVTLELEQELDINAVVTIAFPEEFDLSTIRIAGSNEINGGFRVVADKNILTLKRSGLGRAVPSGKKASIIFGPLKNPDHFESDVFAQIAFKAKGFGNNSIRQKIKFE